MKWTDPPTDQELFAALYVGAVAAAWYSLYQVRGWTIPIAIASGFWSNRP